MGQNAIKLFKINVLFEILANLKSALKNHKKVVDKNVPLNRLGLTLQNWLNEPVLKGLITDFEDEKSRCSEKRVSKNKARGAHLRAHAPRFKKKMQHFY